MSAVDDEKEILQMSVDELRRLYDSVADSFNHLRSKALALLAGEVAIVAFLFASNGDKSIFASSVPAYGAVIWGLAALSLAVAFVMFLAIVSSVRWTHPPEEKDMQDLNSRFNNDPVKFLGYLKNEYLSAIGHCVGKVNARADKFTWGIYALSIGTFILLLLKYGRSIIKL